MNEDVADYVALEDQISVVSLTRGVIARLEHATTGDIPFDGEAAIGGEGLGMMDMPDEIAFDEDIACRLLHNPDQAVIARTRFQIPGDGQRGRAREISVNLK
ncbi:MAG: hypothetical protein IIA00_07820 [Proteobacteria bacterium]|nr:hypothetical protein [Pseudomonadota bacterium]